MKFKMLAVTFNIVLFALFFTIFLLSFSIPNKEFAIFFWKRHWYFVPFFIFLITSVNILYFNNIKIISYMESEDWPALTMFLEEEVFDKKKLSFKNVRVLSETLFLLDDFAGLERLELILKKNKPKYALKLSLKFAAGKMLAGKYEEVKNYCGKIALMPGSSCEWMDFYTAFAHHMLKEYSVAAEKFYNLIDEKNNILIIFLSSYFVIDVLKPYITQNEKKSEKILSLLNKKIKSKHSKEEWKKYTDKERQNIHIMVFTKIIKDANEWFFENN